MPEAYFYGHTHEWQYDRRDHLHLINQPAVSYYFGKGHAHGWVDMKLMKPPLTSSYTASTRKAAR